jgi:cyclopropane fatty-acyl-phospholipid synthase-like methyltransferase
MATMVGAAAGISAGDRVLEIACGAGDGLPLWVENFGAHHVTGIDVDPSIASMARTPCEAAFPGRIAVLAQSALACADLPAQGFDRIVCVDAAYLLSPRGRFLTTALHCLRPGGTLAFTDLTLTGRRGAAMRTGAHLCGIDLDDLAAPHEQAVRLAHAGFEAAQVESLDERVLAGFSDFALRQTRVLGRDAWRAGWRKPLATALMIRAMRGSGLGYALMTARRPAG